MDTQFQSSFIPKKPLIGADTEVHRAPVNFFAVIGLIIFILSILAAAGTFFWVKILQTQLAANKEALKQARDSFKPSVIADLKKVNVRLDAANEILTNHIALSHLFDLIEAETLKDVRFNSLTYTNDPKGIKLTLKGEAASFTAIALQSDVFGKEPMMSNPIISDLALLDNGKVAFQLSADLAPALFKIVSESNVALPAETASSTIPAVATPVPTPNLLLQQ